MKMYVFEGTPEEIGQVFKQMEPSTEDSRVPLKAAPEALPERIARPPLPLGNVKPSENYEEKAFVTVKFARDVMTRIELSKPLRAVLTALYGAHPQWVSAADLYAASGYDGQRFAGLMGAFGRRMKYTKKYDEEAHFFDFDWDDDANAWRYRLPDTVREAMKTEGLV